MCADFIPVNSAPFSDFNIVPKFVNFFCVVSSTELKFLNRVLNCDTAAEFAANCTARIGLRCRDAIESRQIIGNNAAASLPFIGYGYYLTPKLLTPELVKIPYINDDELLNRVRFWKNQKQ